MASLRTVDLKCTWVWVDLWTSIALASHISRDQGLCVSFGRREKKEKTKPAYFNMAWLQRLQRMPGNSAQQSRVALSSVSFTKIERITLVKVSFPRSTFSIFQLVRGHKFSKGSHFWTGSFIWLLRFCAERGGGVRVSGNATRTSWEYDLPRLNWFFLSLIHSQTLRHFSDCY